MTSDQTQVQVFSAVLRAYRKAMGWTQGEVAERWSYSFETISAWERGKRFPSSTEIPRLASWLGMTTEELAAVVVASKRGPVSHNGSRPGSPVLLPFSQGRLLWSLHIGIQDEGLACIISCPLAPGESWEIVLDPERDGADIEQVYRLVNEHIVMKGVKQPDQEVGYAPNVVRFGPVA